MLRRSRVLALGPALLAFSACAQMCAPDQVGTGVARLTVRNVGTMASLVAADTSCGFGSAEVLTNPTIDGAVGSEGTVTWTVTGCVIDLGGGQDVGTDCNDVSATASGKFTISARKVVAGLLTGLVDPPVVPGGPDAATIDITKAEFEDFEVTKSNSDNVLKMVEGSVVATFKPRLAVAAENGACSITTPNAEFTIIEYGESTVLLTTPSVEEEVPIASSSLQAVNGVKGELENHLEGTITVWGSQQAVPMAGDTDGLDPDYDAQTFIESFSCDTELTTPVSYECLDITPMLADNAARLTVKSFATVASIVSADESCGFSSMAVAGAPSLDGEIGGVGSATFTVTDCAIAFAAETALGSDCSGASTLVQGTVTVSGTKTVTGRLTGDPTAPVIPTSDAPAVVELDIAFNDFRVGSSDSPNVLLHKSGSLAGSLSPRVALAASGACEVQSSVARLNGLTYRTAEISLSSASGTFNLDIGTSSIDAVNGTWGEESNTLSGSITVDGEAYPLTADGYGLDPEFDQATFDASWQCDPDLLLPISHDCAFVAPLTQGAARATVRNFGTIASLISADTTCGFGSAAVVPGIASGTPFHQGTMTFTIPDCVLTIPDLVPVSTDCSGATTSVRGEVTVSGSKTVTGWITGSPTSPVVPTSDAPAVVNLTISFNDFEVQTSDSDSVLTNLSGTLSGTLIPQTAVAAESGACEIQSKVFQMLNLTYTDADLVLVSEGRTYGLTAQSSAIDAWNGTWDEHTNALSGTVTVDGVPYPVPIDGGGLDPDFDQAAFDAGWQCAPGLVLPVSHQCSFLAPLAQGAGRGIIMAVGTANKMLDNNDSCGFSSPAVVGAPTAVSCAPPCVGSITWSTAATPCAMHVPVETPVVTPNCTGTARHVTGAVTATTDKTVMGQLTGVNPPVVPGTPDAATFTHTAMVFEEFTVYDVAAGEDTPSSKITLSGTVTGVASPIAGESVANPGVYSVSTPVGGLSDLHIDSGTLTLVSGDKTFMLTLGAVDLDAFNGMYEGAGNSIAGTVTVEGAPVPLPDPRLDPDFTQATFDASYACTPDLAATVSPAAP